MSSAANYTAERVTRDGVEVVRLSDATNKTEVAILPSAGNLAFEMKVNGKDIFSFPSTNLAAFREKPSFSGNPFMAPWANRLDHEGFYANGKHYSLDPGLKNLRLDGNKKPIHGLLAHASEWNVVSVKADTSHAEVISRLEFFRHPDYMAQFPFAHTIDMVHRLRDGVLEVEVILQNHAVVAMPVSIGFHPYFRLHDAPRDEWKVVLPAREHLILSKELIPTGETEPVAHTGVVSLAGAQLDDVYGNLTRGESGRAEFSVQGKKEKISVLFGPKYPIAVVYAP
ncbi:MAG TPA: aldose 1-epimerase, partial [Bryobacteraceae bacterium]|nr:aldose 1-epimerase [Bryobacteraceae bacterium]